MNHYINALKNYAVFSGRATRKEFWMFYLINFLISFVIGFTEAMLEASGAIGLIYTIAMLCPTLAIIVRRLHDTGRSGFWLLILLLPIIGLIVMFVLLVLKSQRGLNEYDKLEVVDDTIQK